VKSPTEVRINGLVQVNSRVTKDVVVPIGWVTVADRILSRIDRFSRQRSPLTGDYSSLHDSGQTSLAALFRQRSLRAGQLSANLSEGMKHPISLPVAIDETAFAEHCGVLARRGNGDVASLSDFGR
jgi:hypothetical protein